MLEYRNIPGDLRDHIVIPLVATGDLPETYAIWHAPFDARIRDIVVIWSADLTGAAGNATRIVVTNRGTDGSGVATLATVDYNSGAITGFEAYALYDPATWLEVDEGTVISITLSAGAGAGENMPPAAIFISYDSQ